MNQFQILMIGIFCWVFTEHFVWIAGSNVRIDTTLLGFDQSNWQRGSRSYVFKGQGKIYFICFFNLLISKFLGGGWLINVTEAFLYVFTINMYWYSEKKKKRIGYKVLQGIRYECCYLYFWLKKMWRNIYDVNWLNVSKIFSMEQGLKSWGDIPPWINFASSKFRTFQNISHHLQFFLWKNQANII